MVGWCWLVILESLCFDVIGVQEWTSTILMCKSIKSYANRLITPKLKVRQQFKKQRQKATLPETNIAPENGPSQKETGIPTIHFQVRLLLVSRRLPFFQLGTTCQVVLISDSESDPSMVAMLTSPPSWVVATQICLEFSPRKLGKIPILTTIFQMGWNHQPENLDNWKATLAIFV